MTSDIKSDESGGINFYHPITLHLHNFKNSDALVEKILKETGDETKALAEKISRIVEENGILAEVNHDESK